MSTSVVTKLCLTLHLNTSISSMSLAITLKLTEISSLRTSSIYSALLQNSSITCCSTFTSTACSSHACIYCIVYNCLYFSRHFVGFYSFCFRCSIHTCLSSSCSPSTALLKGRAFLSRNFLVKRDLHKMKLHLKFL